MSTKLFAETVCADDHCDFFLKWSDGSDFVHDPGIDRFSASKVSDTTFKIWSFAWIKIQGKTS